MRRLLTAMALLAPALANAQISPGELSRFHQSLEGIRNCRLCHEAGKGVTPALCLTCHTALGQRIAAGQGLHARSEYGRCERCHVEHQGRGFDLVFWGERGSAAFDHAQTGFPLRGRHAAVGCRTCHEPNRVRDRASLARGGANLGRTFLGLGASCGGCHADPHAGRLGADCADCHAPEDWSRVEAGRFDHARTRFPLTGRHASVACTGCHARQAGGKLRFEGTAFQSCASCHRDPHAGRLGTACATCHVTAAWDRVASGRFDHDRTRFPLAGRHASVACASCHRGGRLTMAHARCTDCHADRHAGQLARRADGGRCESCHTVDGFAAVRFTVDDHAQTRYPLAGAHLAVPCDACHREVPLDRIRALGLGKGAGLPPRTEQLRFPSTRCAECHRDPHRGQTAAVGACETCHRTDSWSASGFDHARTGFPLADGHARVPCRSCHPGADGALAFSRRPRDCAGCHQDPHGGQFARSSRTDCARCHVAVAWADVRFDHDRETAFPLVGAHRAVPCAGCHRARGPGDPVRYSGLGKACGDCHAPQGTNEPRGAR
jgi:hypothetical protein